MNTLMQNLRLWYHRLLPAKLAIEPLGGVPSRPVHIPPTYSITPNANGDIILPINKTRSSKHKLWIVVALVCVALAIIAAVFFAMQSLSNTEAISNFTELKTAIEGHKTINCTLKLPNDDAPLTLKATDGWSMVLTESDGLNALIIKDDAVYVWQAAEPSGETYEYEEDWLNFRWLTDISPDEIQLECEQSTDVQLSIPKDKSWQNNSEIFYDN
jgi:hypothetical protein